MPLILSQKRRQTPYDDVVGELYHFPRRYRSYLNPGEPFVYYHPSETGDRGRYYFGMGRIGTVYQDPARPDHGYAEILDYLQFTREVPFRSGGVYLEARPDAGTQFFRAVRLISDEVFNIILEGSGLDPEDETEFRGLYQVRLNGLASHAAFGHQW